MRNSKAHRFNITARSIGCKILPDGVEPARYEKKRELLISPASGDAGWDEKIANITGEKLSDVGFE